MSKKIERSLELFETCNCAQAVFGACGPAEGLDENSCLLVASAFGGGMARSGGTCGAVTGALMAIGYRESKKHAGDPAIKALVYAEAGKFMENFSNRFGSLTCRELTGCDLRTPEGQEKFKAVHHPLCEKLVAGAVELVESE